MKLRPGKLEYSLCMQEKTKKAIQTGKKNNRRTQTIQYCPWPLRLWDPSAPSVRPTTRTLFLLCLSSASSALLCSDFTMACNSDSWLPWEWDTSSTSYNLSSATVSLPRILSRSCLIRVHSVVRWSMLTITATLLASITSRIGLVMTGEPDLSAAEHHPSGLFPLLLGRVRGKQDGGGARVWVGTALTLLRLFPSPRFHGQDIVNKVCYPKYRNTGENSKVRIN